jgi:molybdopterin-biosynthesis enzyme MoeA-like protein
MMFVRALCVSGLVAALVATSAIGSNYSANPPPASVERAQHGHRMVGLPKELKIMWRKEEHTRLKAMPKEERRGWLRRQWQAMSESQQHRKVAELQAKWNALPQNVRQALLEKKREKREARRMEKTEGGKGGEASPHPH